MKTRIVPAIILGMTLTLLTACMNLWTSTSSATRFYLLNAMPQAVGASSGKNETVHISIGVGPVSIPSYLDRPQIVTRVDDNKLFINDFHQWAEPLKANISRVMREDLAQATGARHTVSYPWKQSAAVDYQISLDILRFDGDATGKIELKAVWRIVGPDGRRLLIERQSIIGQASAGTDIADRVEAMSITLAELSREIADDCLKLAATQ